MFAGNADAAGVAEVGAVRGVAGEGEDGVGECLWVVRRHEQAVFAVVHDFGEVADAAGDDGESGGVVFVDFQRREVEVVLRRVGGGGDVDLAEGGGNVGGGDAAADVGVGSEAAGGKVGFEVCPAGAVADDVQARGGVFGVDAGEGFDQERQAVPGFEGAEEADAGLSVAAGGADGQGGGEGLGFDAVGEGGDAPVRPVFEVGGDAGRDGDEFARAGKGALGDGFGFGGQDEFAVGALFVDERRVDFEDGWDARRFGVAHADVTPEGVAFVEEVVGAVGGDGGGDGIVRGKDGTGAGLIVAFGRRGQRHEVDGFESRRRGAVDAVGKEGDAVSGADEGTDDVLYVDGRAFVAIDGDAGVGAEVGDVFFHVGFAVGFTYAVAGGVYVYWEGCRFANFPPLPCPALPRCGRYASCEGGGWLAERAVFYFCPAMLARMCSRSWAVLWWML